jgi:phosphate transport system substrate-binding protein
VGKWLSRTSVVRIVILLVIGVALGVAIYLAPPWFAKDEPIKTEHLKAGGTNSVYVILANRWRTAYNKEKGVEVDYDSTGSTAGVNGLIDRKYAVAFTHAPLSEEQKKKAKEKGGEVVQIPLLVCGVVPVYNVEGLAFKPELTAATAAAALVCGAVPAYHTKPRLNLTGDVLAGIYLGTIKKWNDPALKKLNEGVDLPDADITPVHREDSSGTTAIFTDYLLGSSDAWKEKVNKAGSEVPWPAGVGAAGARNNGVAGHVLRTPGAIGYVDLLYAFNNEDVVLEYGAVQNKEKTAFVHADPDNLAATLKAHLADVPEDLAFGLTNQTGKDSYPLCGVIYAVCYQSQPAAEQKKVADFLRWITHDGQKWARENYDAPLPEELVKRTDTKIDSIKAGQ